MHLSLVPARGFDFETDFHTPLPSDALAATLQDAPGENTPPGLETFRYFLTDSEVDLVADTVPTPYELKIDDLRAGHSVSIVPLVTSHYARIKLQDVFAIWQSAHPERQTLGLAIAANGAELSVTLVNRKERNHG